MRRPLATFSLCISWLVIAQNLWAEPRGAKTPLDSVEAQVTRIFEQSRDAVVRIHARAEPDKIRRRPDLPSYRVGTGFIVDKSGRVVTTASNVDDADNVEIEWNDQKFPAILLGIDLYANLAMLRIDSDKTFPELTLGDSDNVKPGSSLITIGFPYNLGVTPTWGLVGGIDASRGRSVFQVAHIRSSLKVSPGQGGGPLLNSKGEVVGVIVASTQLDDATYSLPSNAIKKLRDDFLSRGHARYGWTGLSVVDQTFKLDEHGQTEKRPVVTAIAPDSPAAKSDLRVGDVILNLDGKAIKNSAEIPSTTFFKREGDELLLRIQRGGATKLLSLHLGARPATFVPFQPREPLPQVPQLAPLTPPLPTILPASATVSK